jgi:2,4-dienoyl-CoA reductase-like NADH-dependent reductase (Old Yellow Enzyme family)
VTELNRLVARMERGEFDLIAVGRALLADPHWVEKVRANRPDELRDFDAAALKELA